MLSGSRLEKGLRNLEAPPYRLVCWCLPERAPSSRGRAEVCGGPHGAMLLAVSILSVHGLLVSRPSAPQPILQPAPQVLSLFDPKTRSKVVLVGTMHFNPSSVALAKDIVASEAASGRLRAVAVESCPTRWNATLEAQPVGSLMRILCDNEMQSAAEAGELAAVPIELVDQTIEETGRRIVQALALTLVELLTPFNGGWERLADDCRQALQQVNCDEGLRPRALLDPRLLIGAPVSLVRYPLSLGLRSPLLLFLVVFGTSLVSGSAPDPDADSLAALAASLGFTLLETVVLARVLLVVLLEERNYVIAVRTTCTPTALPHHTCPGDGVRAHCAFRTCGSRLPPPSTAFHHLWLVQRNIRKACFAAKPGGSVVAVLGMAHCNGVAQLLRGSRIV